MKRVVLASLMAATFAANATEFKTAPPVHVVVKPTEVTNVRTNAQQSQRQSQSNRQQQRQRSSSDATATGGNAVGGSGGAGGTSSADTVNSGNNTNIHVPRTPPSSAANITVMPTAVCAGTTGAGAQNSVFGFSFGTSWTDENCMRLERVRNVAAVLGDTAAAEEIMCNDKEYKEARERLGRACITNGTTRGAGGITQVDHDPALYAGGN